MLGIRSWMFARSRPDRVARTVHLARRGFLRPMVEAIVVGLALAIVLPSIAASAIQSAPARTAAHHAGAERPDTGARLATLLAAKRAAASGSSDCPIELPPYPTYAPVLGNNCSAVSDAPSYIQNFEQNAVDEVLTDHDLPSTDYDAVLSWGRDDVRAQEWADLAEIITEPASSRSTEDQEVYTWFQGVVQTQQVAILQAAVNEYLKWSGLTMGTISDSPLSSGPNGTGYCNYSPPANSPSVSDNPTDAGNPLPYPCLNPCPSPTACLAGPTYPSPNDFVTWGETDVVNEQTAAAPNNSDISATEVGTYVAAAIGATLVGTGAAVPLAASLAGTSLAGTAFQTALFPKANIVKWAGTADAEDATEVEEVASAEAASSAVFVIGVIIFATIVITTDILELVSDASVETSLVQALQQAKATPPDLNAMLTGSNASTDQTNYASLAQAFIDESQPDVAYDCDESSNGDPCISPTPATYQPDIDPTFLVSTQNGSGAYTQTDQDWIYAKDQLGGDDTQVYLHGNGWFLSTKYDATNSANLNAPTDPGITMQELQFPYTDWSGNTWVAERVVINGEPMFAITPAPGSDVSCETGGVVTTHISTCITSVLDIQEPNGTDAIAQIVPATGPPSVTASVPSTALSGTQFPVSAQATGGVAPYTYSWEDQYGEIASGQNTSLTLDDLGDQAVTLTVTDSNGVETTETYWVGVSMPPPTVTVTASSSSPFVVGQPVTFTATVTPTACDPEVVTYTTVYNSNGTTETDPLVTGCASAGGDQVQFLEDGVAIGAPVTLTDQSCSTTEVNGQITYVCTSLPISSATAQSPPVYLGLTGSGSDHVITAEYLGDTQLPSSVGTLSNLQVDQAPTSVTVTPPTYPVAGSLSNPVTISAHVAAAPPSTGGGRSPTGTVQFEVNGTDVGDPVTLDEAGNANLSTVLPQGNAPFGAGGEDFTAVYSGDNDFLGSQSSASSLPDGPVAVASDGTHLWSLDAGTNSVVERSLTNGSIVQVVSGANYGFAEPEALTVADGQVFVANEGNNSVTVINASTGALVSILTAAVDSFDFGSTLTPQDIATDGSRIYVANPAGNTVSIIDASSLGLYAVLSAPENTTGGWGFSDPAAIFVANGNVYVACNGAPAFVIEFSAATWDYVGTTVDGGGPIQAMTGVGTHIWVAYPNYLIGYNVSTGVITGEKVVYDANLADLGVVGANLWATEPNSNSVIELSGSSASTLRTISAAGDDFDNPYALAYDGKHLWVANLLGQSLTELTNTGTLTAFFGPTPSFSEDSPGSLGAVGTPYSYAYTVSETGVTFALASGALPPGLKLNKTTGLLSGTPTTAGSYTFTVAASNPEGTDTGPSTSIDVMGQGDVLVADSGNSQVVDVPANGGARFTVGTGLADPFGVAVDSSGDVFISDFVNSDVVEVPADGAAQHTVGSGFANPEGLAVDSRGDLYVADYGNAEVKEVPAGGGSPVVVGTGIVDPTGVAVDDAGDVYIADFGGGQVDEVAADGTQTTVASGLNYPDDVAVNKAGDVFVSEQLQSSLTEFLPDGTQASVGTGFISPFAVALDASNHIYVADYGNNQIDELGYAYFTGFNGPAGVAIFAPPPKFSADAPGTLGAVGTAYSYTYKASSPAGEPTPTFAVVSGSLPPGLSLSATGKLSGKPTAPGSYTFTVAAANEVTAATATTTIDVLGVDDVIAADLGNDQVVDVPSNGGPQFTVGSGFSGPFGVAVDKSGDVFVSDTDLNTVVEIPANGGPQTTFASGLSSPKGLSVDAQGDVFVAEYGTGQVDEIPAGGGSPTVVASGLVGPTGVAVDIEGNVYVADDNGAEVEEYPAAGGGPISIGSGFTNPSDVAVSPTGIAYVSDQTKGQVAKIPSGGSQTFIGSGLNDPFSVALDAAGDLLVADFGNARVARITASTTTAVGSGFYEPTGVAAFAPPPTFTATVTTDSDVLDYPYSYTFKAKDAKGEPNAKFRIASGSLPPGMTLSSSGLFSGTPNTAGTFTFVVEAYNGATGTLAATTTFTVG